MEELTGAGGDPGIDIPELRKKEEEKKGGGVPWTAGSGSGASGAGYGVLESGAARVGSGLSGKAGFLGSGKIAAAISNLLGGPGTTLGGLFASQLGSHIVLGGLAMWGAVVVGAGFSLMNRGNRLEPIAPSLSMSGSMASSGIVIDAPKNRSLNFVANANQGEIVWDPGQQASVDAPKEEPKPAEPPAAGETPQQPVMPDLSQLAKAGGGGLSRDDFVKKMTQDPGMLRGSPGGGKALKDGLSGFNLKKNFVAPPGKGSTKDMSAFERTKQALGTSRVRSSRVRAERAMGQLKFAKFMSKSGSASAPDTQARQFSADAFDQGKTGAGVLGATDPNGIVVPPGDGAPDIGDGLDGENVTPYQDKIDAAKTMTDTSGNLQAAGLMMVMVGLGMIVTGIGLLNCTTFPIGLMLIGAGTAMLMMGLMMLMMSGNMAKNAKKQGDSVSQDYGQQDQGNTVKRCATQANATGAGSEDCSAYTPTPFNPQLPEDIRNESESPVAN